MTSPSRMIKEEQQRALVITPIPPTPFGKYVLVAKLGQGGMAEVNLAVLGGKGGFRKLFVIKRLHPHLEAEPGFVDMFLDEARLAAQLEHPNCVHTVEVGEVEGPGGITQHFLAMEYLDGQGLERIMRIVAQRNQIIPIHVSARIVADALDGLGYAHDLTSFDGKPLGVVHRDVSPQNIFVTYAGVVKILDFGIAKAESNVVETRTGIVKGKYAYMAPEQALAGKVDRRADLWSMGVVFWEMLTSRRLFKSANELATLNATLREEIVPPSRYNPEVPPEIDAIVMRALERDVEKRYSTAQVFKEDIEKWLTTLPNPPDRKAIAGFLKETLGELIEEHHARIRECVASLDLDSRSIERLFGASGTVSLTGSSQEGLTSTSNPSLPSVSGFHAKTGSFSAVQAAQSAPLGETPARLAPASPWLLVIAASLGSALLAIGVWSLMHTTQSAPPSPPPPPLPSPSASPPVSPATSSPLPPSSPVAPPPAPPSSVQETTASAPQAPSPPPPTAPSNSASLERRGGRGKSTTSPQNTQVQSAVAQPLPASPPPPPSPPEPQERSERQERAERQERSTSPSAPPGYLSLVTSPWTQVSIEGGRVLGETPLVRVPLPPGTYTLRLRNPRENIDETYEITIQSGETVSRRLGLR
ncbi:MAG: serine/threonine-protein kinase [Sandaracinaceae bacterium]|nr:serine/threonine-protein kinase [Sandaracinaceae bacterium]